MVEQLTGKSQLVERFLEDLAQEKPETLILCGRWLARHAGTDSAPAVRGATLEEMLSARIARLEADARALLEVLAVSAGPIGQDVSAIAARLSTAEHAKAASILRAAHLARTDGVRRSDRIVTYHDRVREHVYAQALA